MSKLNKKLIRTTMGVSANGNPQFKKAPEQQLLELVVGSLYGKDSYYESGNDKVARMIKVLDKVVELHGVRGARYAMNVARLAREEMSIRTMPIVMTVMMAWFPSGMVLYWITNTLISALQQWRINKLVAADSKHAMA